MKKISSFILMASVTCLVSAISVQAAPKVNLQIAIPEDADAAMDYYDKKDFQNVFEVIPGTQYNIREKTPKRERN